MLFTLAHASLDIENGGPCLTYGDFEMRVTNAGIVGNAFSGIGLSFDPSFEFPSHSGNECLNYAALWVGARVDQELEARVSGGPLLEWRPSIDSLSRARSLNGVGPGRQRLFDDDQDGHVDEEWLDGRDDDFDGLVDEDVGMDADQVVTAAYSDTEEASVRTIYPNGETHRPLHLAVRQVARTWSSPSLRGAAGLTFEITNVGASTLRDVFVGLYTDLDSRAANDARGHLNDRFATNVVSIAFDRGTASVTVGGVGFEARCSEQTAVQVSLVSDNRRQTNLPSAGVMGLGHTVDPLAWMPEAKSFSRAPREVSFRHTILLPRAATASGGVPLLDSERYSALRGDWSTASADLEGDYSVLVSCGPFARLDPGESIRVEFALVAGATSDDVIQTAKNLLGVYVGSPVNLVPDSLPASQRNQYLSGVSGTFGHEACVEPPPGITFDADPHCSRAFEDLGVTPQVVRYQHGQCIWTNADCDLCTGTKGRETQLRWVHPGLFAPSPAQHCVAGDRKVTVSWNNAPEVLASTGQLSAGVQRVYGYRIYRLADWRGRTSALPPQDRWALLSAYSIADEDTLDGEQPISGITNRDAAIEDVLHEQRIYETGRYSMTDTAVFNGHDYEYRIVTVVELESSRPGLKTRLQGPLLAALDDLVRPQSSAGAGGVWVVPNPYRGRADWDRPQVPAEVLTRHIDFMGLPRATAVIKVWTVAGDLVVELHHDGSSGDGQASWNLVSRNGQEVASGIYLFTVESPHGNTTGRFVIIR